MSPQASTIVTLVHGTWGRGFFRNTPHRPDRPRWFEEGSAFRTGLIDQFSEAGLDYEIQVFEWSGANSVSERWRAALELRRRIARRAKISPAYEVIIGHSHGGTLALMALGNKRPPLGDKTLLVTIATPFITFIEKAGVTGALVNQFRALFWPFF